MRVVVLGAVMLVAAVGVAHADEDIMASRFGNTTDTVDSQGVHTKIYYKADHTLTANSAGNTVSGTWRLKGDQICLTYFAPAAESCVAIEAHKVGDTWTTGEGALKRTVTLRAGIQ